jgi:Polyketide cyclase / dehydrase and lipid transport
MPAISPPPGTTAGKRRRGTVSITDDKQHRSAHIHWPADADPDRADLFAHNDIVINAPAEVIWDRLIRAAAWPDWYSNAASVTVNDPGGVLGPGVTFDWVTFGAAIHSTVHEFAPASRIGWYATTDQWLAYHTWLLVPRSDGSTYVVHEETDDGPNPRKLAEANPGHLHRGHDLWDFSLKFLCES